jgi:hypothetical protein
MWSSDCVPVAWVLCVRMMSDLCSVECLAEDANFKFASQCVIALENLT